MGVSKTRQLLVTGVVTLLSVISSLSFTSSASAAATQDHIVYWSDRFNNIGQLFVSDGTGLNEVQLTSNSNTFSEEPAWSPDGTRIVYDRFTSAAPVNQLAVMTYATRVSRNITNNENIEHTSPVWSPDGQWIAYLSQTRNRPAPNAQMCISLIRPDGRSNHNVLCVPQQDRLADSFFGLTWSPDSQRLLSDRMNSFLSTLFSVKTDGTEIQTIATNPVGPITGNYSPDGRTVAFSMYGSSTPFVEQIFTADADGSNQHQLTNDPDRSRRVEQYSPDGQRFLLSSFGQPDFQVNIRTIKTDLTDEVIFPATPAGSNNFVGQGAWFRD